MTAIAGGINASAPLRGRSESTNFQGGTTDGAFSPEDTHICKTFAPSRRAPIKSRWKNKAEKPCVTRATKFICERPASRWARSVGSNQYSMPDRWTAAA